MIDLVRADVLKLRKRRGLFWWSLALTAGSMLAYYGVKKCSTSAIRPATARRVAAIRTPAQWTCSCSRRV